MFFGIGGIVLAPILAIAGANEAMACAGAYMQCSRAEEEFPRILEASHAGQLKSGLQSALEMHRSECSAPAADSGATETPDTLIEIDNVTALMSCPLDEQQMVKITVHWRALGSESRTLLMDRTTICTQTSSKLFPEWFADVESRGAIELLLSRAGHQIAQEWVGAHTGVPCSYRLGPPPDPFKQFERDLPQ